MWIQSLQLNLFSGYMDTFKLAEADSLSWAEAASVSRKFRNSLNYLFLKFFYISNLIKKSYNQI